MLQVAMLPLLQLLLVVIPSAVLDFVAKLGHISRSCSCAVAHLLHVHFRGVLFTFSFSGKLNRQVAVTWDKLESHHTSLLF